MRSEFEKNRYWIGLYRSDVDFDETIGEFGRYVANGSRSFDAIDLEAFNEKWEAYANAWQHQQSKVDELQNNINLLNEALDIKEQLNQKLREREDELQKRVYASLIAFEKLKDEINELHGQCDLHLIKYLEEKSQVLEQALKGGSNEAN